MLLILASAHAHCTQAHPYRGLITTAGPLSDVPSWCCNLLVHAHTDAPGLRNMLLVQTVCMAVGDRTVPHT